MGFHLFGRFGGFVEPDEIRFVSGIGDEDVRITVAIQITHRDALRATVSESHWSLVQFSVANVKQNAPELLKARCALIRVQIPYAARK